jgi:hypothetical protein
MKAPVAWFGARPGLGLGYVSNKLERKRQFCFDDGAIVRFHYCDISAMALLRQHINQRFSVGTEAVARIQPETETTLALLMAQGGGTCMGETFLLLSCGAAFLTGLGIAAVSLFG